MACRLFKASAPGSLMLFGEHAVLRGKLAVVTAIDRRVEVVLTPQPNSKAVTITAALGKYEFSIDRLQIKKPYTYVLTAIATYLNKIKCGFSLDISANFPADIGFGSSAAVTVATLGALSLWLDNKVLTPPKLYRRALKVVRLVQGVGSGADVAASVFGGVLAYKVRSEFIKQLNVAVPLVAVYSGKKTATSQVIAKVYKDYKNFPEILSKLDAAIEACSVRAVRAIKNKRWADLGVLANIHQGLHDALGVSDEVLSDLIFSVRKHKNIYGAKISGSGLGDCVVGIGKLPRKIFPKNKEQKEKNIRQVKILVDQCGYKYSYNTNFSSGLPRR